MTRNRVLFICTHNAARSQMAEGYLRARYGERFRGIQCWYRGIGRQPVCDQRHEGDRRGYFRAPVKLLKEFSGVEMDVAVVVCDAAKSACPFFPWAKETIHATFRNPREFSGTDDQIRAGFREIRDEITVWIDHYVAGNA